MFIFLENGQRKLIIIDPPKEITRNILQAILKEVSLCFNLRTFLYFYPSHGWIEQKWLLNLPVCVIRRTIK